MRFGYDAVTGHPNASTELEFVFSFIEPSRVGVNMALELERNT